MYVAENNGGTVVGFAWGGKHIDGVEGYEGELRAMYILEDYKKKRIGSRLFDAVTKRLLKKGITSMLVCVLAENPSRAFYEKKGGKVIGDRLYEKEGKFYSALEYGWGDLEK